MKISKLWVSKYKNIENIDLEFKSDLVTLLVGQNGLGKSNLIEILAIIFRDLDLFKTAEEFETWPYSNFEYSIQYECYKNEVRINHKEKNSTIEIKLIGEESVFTELSFTEFKKDRDKKYLPKYIIGYYSGENKRIKEIIRPHEEIQFKELKNSQKNLKKDDKESKLSTHNEKGLRRIFFTENYHSQLLLLTLILFRNKPKFKEKIDELLQKYLGIIDIVDFEITFNNPDWKYSSIENVNKGMDYLISNINSKEKVEYPFWNLKGKVDKVLTRFYNHQIDNGSEPINYPNEGEDDRSFVEEFLVFNSIDFKTFNEELDKYYDHPIEFFDALEATTIVDILNNIKLKVVKKDVEEPIEFNQLSEGEQQLLTVLGLILVTGNKDCLFLLDEPDTHLNPGWQRDYSELLEDFNLNDKNSHIFVATHSPFIVQNSQDSEVILFSKEDGKIKAVKSELFQENWRIDHVLTSKYFGLESVRPKDNCIDEFMKIRRNILDKDELNKEDEEYLRSFEDKIGNLPTGETFKDMKMLQFVNKIARLKGYGKTE